MFSVVYDSRIAVASIFDDIPHEWFVVDCRPLIDGPGNAKELIQNLLAIGLEQLRRGKRICFACDYGHSRSNYMAALAISRISSVSSIDAISIVEGNHPESSVKPTLHQSARESAEVKLQSRAFAITGSNTLLGRLLIKEISGLFGDYIVITIDNCLSTENAHKPIEKALIDNQITDVIHCAFPNPPNSYDSSKKSYIDLIDLIRACLGSKAILHYFSSWSIFEGSTDSEIDEDSQPYPFSLYSQAKSLHEEQLKYAALSSGLVYKIYRTPCLLSREADLPRFLMYMADSAATGRDIYVHRYMNGYPVVPMMEAGDAATLALKQIISPPRERNIIHICENSSNTSVMELGRITAQEYNVEVTETPVSRVAMTGTFKTKYMSKPNQGLVDLGRCFNPMPYVQSAIKAKLLTSKGH